MGATESDMPWEVGVILMVGGWMKCILRLSSASRGTSLLLAKLCDDMRAMNQILYDTGPQVVNRWHF